VLGMNDNAFPRRDAAPSFDAMATQPRAGDPRKADEDRYLLLETLLCAREALYLSYTGRSLTDNAECQPSVLLRELLDCIDAHYTPEDREEASMSACVTRLQPMQPFSRRHFQSAEAHRVTASHDDWWCRMAQALQGEPAESSALPAWPERALEPLPEPATRVELSQLLRFLEHPVKGFFNTRLRVYLKEDEPAEDEEVFTLTGLASWKVGQALVEHWMQGDDAVPALQQRLAAEGLLPHGSQAALAFAQAQDRMQDLWSRLEPWRNVPAQRRHVSLSLRVAGAPQDRLQLQAQILHCHPGLGLLHCTSARLKGKHALKLWLEHLALCATEQLPPGELSVLHCGDTSLSLAPLPAEEASQWLAEYLALSLQGQCRPLPLFPNASYVLSSKGLAQAHKAWEGDQFGGDADDPYLQLAMRGCEGSPIALPEHQRLAQSVYGPLRAAQVTS
jgi:exodeoxyribonuclease V gamma subunit